MTFIYAFVVRSLGVAKEKFSGPSHGGPDLALSKQLVLVAYLKTNKQTFILFYVYVPEYMYVHQVPAEACGG